MLMGPISGFGNIQGLDHTGTLIELQKQHHGEGFILFRNSVPLPKDPYIEQRKEVPIITWEERKWPGQFFPSWQQSFQFPLCGEQGSSHAGWLWVADRDLLKLLSWHSSHK